MTTMTSEAATKPRKWKKVLLSSALGAVVGFAATFGFLHLAENGALGALGFSETVAAVVGMLYVIVGLAIGVGLARPKAGAAFLNVEDAEEIEEQRPMLGYSAATMFAFGAALAIAALGGPGGIFAPAAALATTIGLLVIGVVLSLVSNRYQDELMRALGHEAGAMALGLVGLFGGGWALAAHLGFANGPAPLDWLTMFWSLTMVAAFIVVGKRGMLMPR
ncbi:hypothetical protein [Parerythrobacter lacustris]|uniref:DUF423 domain-containing protein n=1 Tax=Parerythrobacter lacustris TaxID=2969984 RepID=A0ABT1XTA2_9SPHN|nr:hypothetical protein [Parerythrobacter lacustris]MCR2834888.1 hypothetical protein [Parerythrobacter lacustris]